MNACVDKDRVPLRSVLVTGATSFIGAHLTRRLLSLGVDVTAVVRPNTQNIVRLPIDERLTVVEMDITGSSPLPKGRYDTLFHFAWEGARGAARDDEMLQCRNAISTCAIAEAAAQMGVKTFVGAGSQAEYGRCKGLITEDAIARPDTAYGAYKLRACRAVENICVQMDMRFIWPRIFSLYGKWDYEKSLVMTCVREMMAGRPLHLTPCKQMWDFLYIDDAVNALLALTIQTDVYGVFHVAYGESRPLFCYVEEIRATLGSQSEVFFDMARSDHQISPDLIPSVQKIMRATGWRPKTIFRDGICAIERGMRNEDIEHRRTDI